MQSFIQPGHTLAFTAPYNVASGAGVLVNAQFGVATDAVLSAAAGQMLTEGVFSLAKATGSTWSFGQKLYWDDTNKRLTTDAALGPLVAIAAAAALTGDTTGEAKLLGVTRRASGVALEGSPTPTSVATAGAATISAAMVLTRIYVRDCNGSGRTDTLCTAAELVAALPGAKVGDLLELQVINGSDAAETLTLAAGTGGGFDTNQTATSRVLAQNTSKRVLIRLTNVTSLSEAYVVYA